MFTKEDLQIIIQVLNEPRQQNLQTAMALISISNKASQMLDELNQPPKTAKKEKQEAKD